MPQRTLAIELSLTVVSYVLSAICEGFLPCSVLYTAAKLPFVDRAISCPKDAVAMRLVVQPEPGIAVLRVLSNENAVAVLESLIPLARVRFASILVVKLSLSLSLVFSVLSFIK